MIPSLQELRKRLLNRPATPPSPSPSGKPLTFVSYSRLGALPPRHSDETIYLGDASTEHAERHAEAAAADEEAIEAGIQMAELAADDALVEAVAPFFESAGGCRQHLAQLADASRSLSRLGRAADKAFEPLKSFAERVQALLDYYAKPGDPNGALRERLDSIVWLSSTQKPTRSRDDAAAAEFGKYLFEISRSLARAEALRARLMELARALHAAEALHARLRGLFQALDESRTNRRSEPTGTDGQN